MKATKIGFSAILSAFVLLAATSCQDDPQPQGTAAVVFRASSPATGVAALKTAPATGVVIESFKINVSEIELELNDDDNDGINNGLRYSDDIELDGPFEVELVANATPLSTTLTNNANLPIGLYEEIAFEFDINTNPQSTLYQKTILVTGTINGKPFTFHTKEEFEVEVEFENGITLADAQQASIAVSFNLAALFDVSQGGVDITNALDKDGNGTIVINYYDTADANNELADLIEDRIDHIIYSFEDDNDDDNDGDDD